MAAFLLQLKRWGIPGFRSGTPWKQLVATAGYILFVFWLVLADGKRGGTFFALAVLTVALLAANAWNIRPRLPLLGSRSRGAATLGWGVFGIVLIFAWAVAAASETRPAASTATSLVRGSGGVGGGAPTTSTEPSRTHSPTARPTPTSTPTPTPTLATPAPVATKAPPPPPPAQN